MADNLQTFTDKFGSCTVTYINWLFSNISDQKRIECWGMLKVEPNEERMKIERKSHRIDKTTICQNVEIEMSNPNRWKIVSYERTCKFIQEKPLCLSYETVFGQHC